MTGIVCRQNTKPGKHLDFLHPSMVQVREWIQEQVSSKRVEGLLVANFDQVWCLQFRPRRANLQATTKTLEVQDKVATKPALKKIRHILERCLCKPFSDCFDEPEPKDREPVLTGGAASNVPIENWRIPHTLTTLSWANGDLGRGYVTYRESNLLGEKERNRLNQDIGDHWCVFFLFCSGLGFFLFSHCFP